MKFIPNAVTTRVARGVLLSQKNSPTLLFGAGVVGIVASTVLACRATLRVDEILDQHAKKMTEIGELEAFHQGKPIEPFYSAKDTKKDRTYLTIQTAVKIGRLYAPALGLGVASVFCLTKSHNILTQRNAALTAAYATISKAFDGYRERVRDEYGEEKERELYRGVEEITHRDPETGKKTKSGKKIREGLSPYAVFYDEHNKNWQSTGEHNLFFLRCQQNWANDRLKAKGHIFLNEVYDQLGMEHTMEGAVVGWVAEEAPGRDCYVDFGVFDSDKMDQLFDFASGREGIWLDFNVDGTIYDKI